MTSILRAAACALGAAAFVLASCGGSSSNGGGSNGGASGSGGAAGGGGGGTAGGGGGSGGSGAGGSGDTGGGSSGGGSTGSGSGGTGGGGGGGASGGGGGGGGGGSGSGSGSASPCDGLVPAFPSSAVEARFDTGTHAFCTVATSNPTGHVALGFEQATVGAWFGLYSASGVSEEASDGDVRLLQDYLSDLTDGWFHWTGSGWRGIVHDPPPALAVRTWDQVGHRSATLGTLNASWIAPDGRGGSVVLGTNATQPTGSHLVYLDASGAVTHDAFLGAGQFKAVLVAWATGHVLLLTANDSTSGTAWARWYDENGAPITASFDTHVTLPGDALAYRAVVLRGLLDGSIVLFDGTSWVGAFTDGHANMDPAPGWLQSRPGKRLFVRPNGKGYVMLPADQQVFGGSGPIDGELVAPDGTSCGALTAPTAPAPTGADARVPQALFVGQDGTLFVRDGLTGAGLGMGIHCAFRWWPALLQ